MARRDELFEPGAYMAIPFAIARRRDLTWNDKGIWALLAQHLGPENRVCWPSLRSALRASLRLRQRNRLHG